MVIERDGEVTTVGFLDRNILEETSIQQIGEEVGAIIDASPSPKVLLNFDNVEHLLVSLYKRSSVELGESIWNALADAGPDDDLAQVWVRAYFQCSVTQGVVFSALIRPGSAIPAKADRHRSAPAFVARILHRFFGVEQSHADAVSGIVQGAFHGGSNTWLHGAVAETLILDVAADVVRGVVVAAPACDRDDHDHPRTPPDSGRAIGNAS